jgi:SAM-dependent methyltransferase
MHPDDAVANTKKRYQGELGKQYREKHAVPEVAHQWLSDIRGAKFAQYIYPEDTVLEYGVGPGWNLEALRCARRLGYDLSTELKKPLAAKGIDFIADTQTISDASIDTVICHHVLEHTADPAQVLLEIRRLLRPEGRLLLFVPLEKERRTRQFDPCEPNHHLYSWNVQTLGNLVVEMGFQIMESGTGRYGYDRFFSVLAERLKIGKFGFKCLKKMALLIKPLLEVRIIARRANAKTR